MRTSRYDLYSSYNLSGDDIGNLFLTGFLSSAIFGTWVGTYVDKWGRKRGCALYCVLELIINVLEHSRDFKLLLLGRVLGGVVSNSPFIITRPRLLLLGRIVSEGCYSSQLDHALMLT